MSKREYPEWATPKQIEGMKEFNCVADEYGSFNVEFKETDYSDDDGSRIYAVVLWGVVKWGW